MEGIFEKIFNTATEIGGGWRAIPRAQGEVVTCRH